MNFATDIGQPLLLSVLFTVVGVALFGGVLYLLDRLTPFSIHKEIEEDQNVALGIVIGCFVLGVALILAASLVDISYEAPDVIQSDGAPAAAE